MNNIFCIIFVNPVKAPGKTTTTKNNHLASMKKNIELEKVLSTILSSDVSTSYYYPSKYNTSKHTHKHYK